MLLETDLRPTVERDHLSVRKESHRFRMKRLQDQDELIPGKRATNTQDSVLSLAVCPEQFFSSPWIYFCKRCLLCNSQAVINLASPRRVRWGCSGVATCCPAGKWEVGGGLPIPAPSPFSSAPVFLKLFLGLAGFPSRIMQVCCQRPGPDE